MSGDMISRAKVIDDMNKYALRRIRAAIRGQRKADAELAEQRAALDETRRLCRRLAEQHRQEGVRLAQATHAARVMRRRQGP